jgi:hypothetical protein
MNIKITFFPDNYTGCGRNNSHISKNHCGVPKADSRVQSIPLGRVHNKVFSCRHAVVGWASRLCSGGVFKKCPPFGHSEQTKFSLLGCWKPSRTPCTTSSQPKRYWALLFWRGWSHSYCECQSILRHVGELSAPENWWVWGRPQPRGLLVPTGWSYGPYSTSSARNFEGDVPGSSVLLTRGSSVATALTWFKSLWLCLWGYLKAEVFKHRLGPWTN